MTSAIPPAGSPEVAHPDPPPPRPRRRFWRRLALVAGSGLALIVVLAGGLAVHVLHQTERPFRGFEGEEQFVEIARGSGVAAIARQLEEAGVVSDARWFRVAAWRRDAHTTLKAGEYRFTTASSPLEVIDRLVRGDVYRRLVTFREGLSIREKAAVFAAQGLGDAQAFLDAATNRALVAEVDSAAPDLEGYLFPDTYALPRSVSADDVVRMMVERFLGVVDQTMRERAASRGLTIRQLVTLASLVEKETAVPDERPIVAGVFANRLRIGMGLQCDPTVIYALQRAGLYRGNLTREHLRFDSPYNTYRYAGLPPGPIAAPGRASIEAALDPADVPYFYFVSRNDGSHVFATTLREHNENVRRWQVQYFREKRAREQEGPTDGGSRPES